MKRFTSKTQKIGEIGEEVACRFLKKHDCSIIERNYTRKWGEIDILALNKDVLCFIEVKAVSDEGLLKFSRETEQKDIYRPEDNIHPWKLKRLYRTIESYLMENEQVEEWQFDVMLVYLDLENKRSGVRHLKNIV
jgi:putative endonuclease